MLSIKRNIPLGLLMLILSMALCVHGFTVRRESRLHPQPQPLIALTDVICTDWPIIEAKITDFLIRLAVESNGTELHLKDIDTVQTDGNHYLIRAQLELASATLKWCNLVIEEKYAIRHAKMDITCDQQKWTISKRQLMPGGLNEYDPDQLSDLQPMVNEAIAQVQMGDMLELKTIRFAQVQAANSENDGSTYVIFADLTLRELSDQHALCRIIANDRPSGGLKIILFSCGAVIMPVGHDTSNARTNHIDSADYEDTSKKH